jgi:putative tricarboxylic transport membrane protein
MPASRSIHLSRRSIVAGATALGIAGPAVLATRHAAAQDAWPSGTLQIMAPAAPGGGWDTTARELQRVLTEEGIIPDVEVYNVEGAGGTIGLAELVNDHAGDPTYLMVMGLVMIGGIGLNESPVTLEQVTPIARLTGEFEVIVVPADSEYQDLNSLIEAFKADPASISWGGGSAGGTDHILVALIAQAIGADPTQVNYVPFSGGGEALASVMGGQTTAGVSGLSEWASQIEAGELRALAISGRPAGGDAATPVAETDLAASIPTLQDQGVDVELANWRGVVAPPELDEATVTSIISTFDTLNGSAGWQEALATNGWTNLYLAGAEFDAYLDEQIATINQTLTDLGLI